MPKGLWITLAQIAIAVLVGVTTAFQPGVNTKFGSVTGAPIHGSVLNFAVGLCAMLVVAAAMRAPIPEAQRLASGPAWMWVGGLIGATFVTAAIFLSKRMGQGNYLAAMIAGQLVAGVVIDHFGMMEYPRHPVSAGRLAGIALIGAGAVLVRLK